MQDADAVNTRNNLSAIQTRELLEIGFTVAETPENWLLDAGDCELLEMLLTDMCSGTGHSGAALLEAVCSAETPVDVLRAVKDLAKSLAKGTEDDRQRGAASLLYHLAVASALGFHGQNISSMAALQRLPLYQELVAGICDDALVTVFEKAIERLSTGQE